jgi:hypothetical protein
MTTKENAYDPGLTCVIPSSNTGMEPDLPAETTTPTVDQEWEQYKQRHLQTAQKIVAFMHSHD